MMIWLAVVCARVATAAFIDKTSFVHREMAYQYFLKGQRELHDQFSADTAIASYERSFELLPNPVAAYKLAWLLELVGEQHRVSHWQQQYLRNDYAAIQDLMNKGVVHHFHGQYHEAIAMYDQTLAKDVRNFDALYHKGVSYQYLGDVQSAASFYYEAIEVEPFHTKALLNLATLHQRYGSFDDALTYYLQSMDLFAKVWVDRGHGVCAYVHPHSFMVQYNLGLAYFQLDQLDKAYTTTRNLLNQLQPIHHALTTVTNATATTPTSSPSECTIDTTLYDVAEVSQSLAGAQGSLSKVQRAALNWARWEVLHEQLVVSTLHNIATAAAADNINTANLVGVDNNAGSNCEDDGDASGDCARQPAPAPRGPYPGPLLPFDTLMMDVPLGVKLHIAKAASLSYTHYRHRADPTIQPITCTTDSRSTSSVERAPIAPHTTPPPAPALLAPHTLHCSRTLRLGFISYDFNDHPTAHLADAIFHIVREFQRGIFGGSGDSGDIVGGGNNTAPHSMHDVELIIFSYGKNDNSHYRARLQRLAHRFVDIVSCTFQDAADAIRAEKLDILLDLQIHTLGNRLEITAAGVAPIVVNYLVYPGTSGARFYDYIVADTAVVPADHSVHYSERLLLLPATYQISTYDSYNAYIREQATTTAMVVESLSAVDMRAALRRSHGLPGRPQDVVFCNFNKINKIDPESFALWIQVLRVVPNSYLWLLEPSRDRAATAEPKKNLLRSVMAAGVHPNRVIFAPRTHKNAHIQRHAAADLFLDTVVYGAHSTATDALRGGLPVLTLCGEAFPSRVVTSLYASFGANQSNTARQGSPAHLLSSVLVTDSAKDFVDTAARIVRARPESTAPTTVRARLTRQLNRLVEEGKGLFNTANNVGVFVQSMEAIHEAHTLRKMYYPSMAAEKFHVVVL